MGSSNESEIRLAELIWRTIKLRVSLLAFAIVVLLIVWTSLLNGNQEAQETDTKFCEFLVENHNAVQRQLAEQVNKSLESKPDVFRSQPLILSSADLCHNGSSRTWIEITRSTDKELPIEFPLNPAIPPLDIITKAANEKRTAFADYDAQRHAAYRLQFQLSSEYSSSTIIVNAMTVAEVIPFCIFVVLAVILILGFQQSAYRRQLCSLVRNKTGEDLSEVMAETQFFAAPLFRNRSRPERYLVSSPADLAISALTMALILLLIAIISTFLLNLVQLTDSMVLSYPFALYVSLSILIAVIVVTRKSYAEFAEPKIGPQKYDSDWRPSKGSKWLTFTCALISLVSLAFPWVTESIDEGNFIRGYQFLLNQRPSGRLFNYTTYAFSPSIFRDVRIQVTVAVVFLGVCILDALFGFHSTNRLVLLMRQIRWFIAACVFVLSLYCIFYIAFLEYESVYWVPWLDKVGYQGSASAKGYSMIWYDPAYGFWIFLVCCLLLVWLSFTTRTDRLNTGVRRLNSMAVLKWKSLAGTHKTIGHKPDSSKSGSER